MSRSVETSGISMGKYRSVKARAFTVPLVPLSLSAAAKYFTGRLR